MQVVASGYTVAEGLAQIVAYQPDQVFLDVEMPDGTGFDLCARMPRPWPAIIFVTAHGHYTIQALRLGAQDYLLKPVDTDELAEAIGRVKDRRTERDAQLDETLRAYEDLHNNRLPTRILVSTANSTYILPIEGIYYLRADQNYTEIYHRDMARPLVSSRNIGYVAGALETYSYFARSHRSYLVNLYQVEAVVSKSELQLKNGKRVPISRTRYEDIMERLRHL
ncbi:MAG: LytTR family transcriptional regulator DNA-binding domain-containing protein [Bacteroidia bacterium]